MAEAESVKHVDDLVEGRVVGQSHGRSVQPSRQVNASLAASNRGVARENAGRSTRGIEPERWREGEGEGGRASG